MPLHVRPEKKKRQEAEVTQAAFFEILIYYNHLLAQSRRLSGRGIKNVIPACPVYDS
jgi:hypothetical protein